MNLREMENNVSGCGNLALLIVAWSLAISYLSTGVQTVLAPAHHIPAFTLWAGPKPRTPFSVPTNYYFKMGRDVFLGILYTFVLIQMDDPLQNVFFLNSSWGVGESALALLAVLISGPRWRIREHLFELVSSLAWLGFVIYWCRIGWNWPAFAFALLLGVCAPLTVVIVPAASSRP